MKRILIATLSLVFLSACPKSCGKKGEDAAKPADGTTAPAAGGDKAAYIKAMDEGCAKAKEDIKAFKPEAETDGSIGYKALHDAMVKAKAVTDKMHADQEKMPRPSADSADLDKYFSLMHDLDAASNAWIDSLQAAIDAPEDQKEAADGPINEHMQKATALAKELTAVSTKYGFHVCGIIK